ncbi:MAG: sacsin N-terminal ATP-binding-like domain-containing protein, partial [Candidatus Helarchaeota archaeon]
MDVKFDELVRKRKRWVASSKENKFDFESILAGLYNDPSHFIYELLQNAEDEGAKEAKFDLFKDRLDFYHNGKDFDINDIEGVTGIGISKKKEDLNLIGKFGVGFKSVFAVTETPYIFSGGYSIKIEDFVVPVIVDNDEEIGGTLIRLPFNHRKRSPEEVFKLISRRLENLGLKTMLFLRNIEEIQWRTPSRTGHYLKEICRINSRVRRVTVISSTTTEEYLVIERPIEIESKNLKVEVAYKLCRDRFGKEIIIPELDSKLVVYFPTEKVTYLNFIIQGPYRTTPNRENIPLEDEQNRVVLKETANLVAESLLVIKELGYLDVNFLNILPIKPEDKEKELIYSVIYDGVKEKLSTDKLLPTSHNKYARANEVLLARGKELAEFLDSNDIQLLFSKKYWLDTDITQDRFPELRDYLVKELDVPEVDFESFARRITGEFLETKSDEWMINFYTKLLDQQTLWSDRIYRKGVLRTKPIIRLENGEHIAPYDENGKVQVYLPEETKSKYKTVKRTLTEDENALKFLKELGLRKPNLFAEIKEFIIPKYQANNPIKDDEYFDDFGKFLKAYKTLPEEDKKEFVRELSNITFIDSVKSDTGEYVLKKPNEGYFKNDDLVNYFEGYPVYFVSDELCAKFEKEDLIKFLKEIGIEDKPRR